MSPLVLLILDGWGYRDERIHNSISHAKTPQWDAFWNEPLHHCLLSASGLDVGLPDGQMGNSEVGHMHIGAGRVLMQDFTRINEAVHTGEFATNPVLNDAITQLKETGKALHVMGLFSKGGVHSHEDHLYALLDLCAKRQFSNVYLHLFLDGRDVPPKSVLQNLASLDAHLLGFPGIQIASIAGRYYAMDRDRRFPRTEAVYRMLTEGDCIETFENPSVAVRAFYSQGVTDEFIPPVMMKQGKPVTDGDALFFFNFRSDRARQITEAFINPDFSGFVRSSIPKISAFISMTEYAKNLKTEVVFPPIQSMDTLGETISRHGLRQLRMAETEKYAHVTFFFNGGVEQIFNLEERKLIPSPKVATYDLQPEMSAIELTDALIDAIHTGQYPVIICNYANADMVGHTGDFTATVKAIECLDDCMRRIWDALEKENGHLLITADHGNAEIMFDENTGQPHTAHTSQPVPFVMVGKGWHFRRERGSLIDIAPTVLDLLGIEPPLIMTGRSLLVKDGDVK